MSDADTSFGKFLYALRPAKNIERKMLCEAFGCFSCFASLRSYRYIGFGSVEFVDFGLLHQRLGIKDMWSIECRTDDKERVEFNRPYSFIKIEWGMSHTVLPTLDWSKKTIIWLDYDKPLQAAFLDDIRLVVSSLVSGSVLVVTVDAKPEEAEGNVEIAEIRLNALIHNVGQDKLPLIDSGGGNRRPVKGADLANWGLAQISRQIINNEIASVVRLTLLYIWLSSPICFQPMHSR